MQGFPSRLKYETCAFVRRSPGGFDLAQGYGLCRDGEWRFGSGGEKFADRFHDFLERGAAESTTEEFEGGAAECGGGE